MTDKTTGLARLREPFPPNQINLLPRNVRKNDTERYQCRQGTKASVDGKYCGGYHSASIHLEYVGHAALTDRLLEVDPEWSWEPMAIGPDGLPVFDSFGGLWIRLTICGITRLGYGDAQGKNGANAIKEAIGDALRNAGMRFGAALDLWHKGDLHDAAEDQGQTPSEDAGSTALNQRRAAAHTQAPAFDWEQALEDAKNNIDLLRDLRAKAIGMGAPAEYINRIDAAGKALAARTEGTEKVA